MASGHSHNRKMKEELTALQKKYHRLDPNFVSRAWSYFPKENFDKFQAKMNKPQRASDIQNLLDTQAINMYGGMPDSTYRRIDGSEYQGSSLGFYYPRTTKADSQHPDDIFLSPRAKAHTFLHEPAHAYGHHNYVDGGIPWDYLNPKDDKLQKFGRTKIGSALGIGGVKTLRGYQKEYGKEAGLEQYKDVHEKGLHPYTTQTFYDKYYEDTSRMPQSLLDSLDNQLYKYADNSPDAQYFRQHGELPPRKPVQAIRGVRGWLQQNVPWIKKGEGWLPDNIYKQGSWFGM